jgi:predicted secreted hydrolase
MSSIHPKYLGKWNVIILGLLLILLSPIKIFAEEFKRALPGKAFSFPRDHYSHPEFKTEWWYYTGHLQSGNRKSYGYQLTFFRSGLKRDPNPSKSKWSIQDLFFAHLALTDESRKKFDYREKISRGSLEEAGAIPYTPGQKPFRVWIEDWSMELKTVQVQNHQLRAGGKDLGIELLLQPEKNPVIHGKNGISHKAEGEGYASHYYSISRLKTSGKVFLQGEEILVQGTSWMDHEFGSVQLREYQAGWDWFSIHLENNIELMFYQIRHKDGKIDPYSSGTMIFTDGKSEHLPLKEFRVEILGQWKSRKSQAVYPSGWKIHLPRYGIELTLSPTVKDQELITEASTRVTYWEGSVKVEGKFQGNPVKGRGYVELTGYAKPFSKGI